MVAWMKILFCGISVLIVQVVSAESGDEHHHHEAHVHGQAEMYLVFEGKELLIELITPAANVFGFEHEPNTEDQLKVVDDALIKLNAADHIIKFQGGDCVVESVEVVSGFDHEHHDHEASHYDVKVAYSFNCEQPDSLEKIEFRLFDYFDSVEAIRLSWVVKSKQGSQSLSKKSKYFELEG